MYGKVGATPPGQGLVDDMLPPYRKGEVVPEIRALRAAAVTALMTAYDTDKSSDARIFFDGKEFELPSDPSAEIMETLNKVQRLRDLYPQSAAKGYDSKYIPTYLEPATYRLMTRNGRPYKVGKGEHGNIFIAQNTKTRDLVAIKAYYKQVKLKGIRRTVPHTLADTLVEWGLFRKGQALLKQKEFVAGELLGFLKIKQGSHLLDLYHHAMAVVSLQSMVENVPVVLTLSTVFQLRDKATLLLDYGDWADIMYQVLKAAKAMNEGGIRHGDFHEGNICMVYRDKSHDVKEPGFKIAIINFEEANFMKDVDEEEQKFQDMYWAFGLIAKLAHTLGMTNTYAYAQKIYDYSQDGTFDNNPKLVNHYSYSWVTRKIKQCFVKDCVKF